MGNCLDIPPPAPKSKHVYFNGIHYVVVRRKTPYVSGSLALMPSGYHDYQQRAADGGFRPVALYPVRGHTYPRLEPPPFTPVYYSECSYFSRSNYGNHGNTTKRASIYHKSQTEREKKSHIKDGATKQALVTTGPSSTDGPSKDVISPNKMVANKSRPINTSKPFISCSTGVRGTNAQDDVCSPERRTSLGGATRIAVVMCSSKPVICKPVQEEVISIMTEFAPEDALSEADVTCEEQQIAMLNDTPTTDEDIVQEHPGEPEKQSTVSDDPPRTSAASDWTNSPGNTTTPSDVVLSYHSADVDVMRKIKHKLQAAGVRTVVSYPTDNWKQDVLTAWLMYPQIVADAKVMIVLLSHHSVKDKHIMDEVCLAQVTETLIYPVALEKCQDLLIAMDVGLKLQVACYKWTQLGGDINSDLAIALMVRCVKEDLASVSSSDLTAEDSDETSEQAARRRKMFCRRQTQKMIRFGSHVTASQYWDKCYGNDVDSVYWDRFHDDLFKVYQTQINGTIDGSFSHNFTESLKREIEVSDDETVFKTQLVEFCNKLGTDQDVWERIYCVARETRAFMEVLSVESTVRAVAIENIGKFGNKSAIVALHGLMADNNPNIRAAAILSLSRSMPEGDEVTFTAIMATLDDKDGFVRETGCLALGHLQARKAVDKLGNIYRHDDIAQVREAAAKALIEITGDPNATHMPAINNR